MTESTVVAAIGCDMVLAAMSRELLSRMAQGQATRTIAVSMAGGEFSYAFS